MTFRLEHDDEGHGPAVVLLHAGVCDRRMWEPQVEALRASFRVVRPDLRGFGDTPLLPGEFSNADDVVALLDHLGLETVTIVGSSFGGLVGLEIAATHAERVERLALLCPAYPGLEPDPEVRAFGAREDELLEAGDLAAAVELNVSTWSGPEATAQVRELVRSMQRRAFEVQLAADGWDDPPQDRSADIRPEQVGATTLVVSGGHDLLHFQRVAEHLAERVPGATHRHLPWSGHLPSLERPEEVSALLLDFLREG